VFNIIQVRSKVSISCHLITLNKINIYNTSCVLTYKNFTPYLYVIEGKLEGRIEVTGRRRRRRKQLLDDLKETRGYLL